MDLNCKSGVPNNADCETLNRRYGAPERIVFRPSRHDAPIVVLDEATAFADPENEALIQKAFVKLTKDRTVIMIAHRLSTVVGADRIIVLDSGHVEEQGTHAELLAANGLYARMWTDYRKAVNWKISQGTPAKSASWGEDEQRNDRDCEPASKREICCLRGGNEEG